MKQMTNEQKSKLDLVSRQDVIEECKAEFLNPNVQRETETQTLADQSYARGWNACNRQWIKLVSQMPSTQTELYQWQVEFVKVFMDALDPDWIPCRKELPPDDRTVLVTLRWGTDDYEITTGEYWHDSPSSPGWGTYEGHVIAWMPLPEPYKDGDTDDES